MVAYKRWYVASFDFNRMTASTTGLTISVYSEENTWPTNRTMFGFTLKRTVFRNCVL